MKYISRDEAGRACLTRRRTEKPAGSLIIILIHVGK